MLPQDDEDRFTIRQFCKGLAFFLVFWGILAAVAMTTFFPQHP